MHEHGLADQILAAVLQHPDRPPHAAPAAITVQVSELGGLTEQALQANLDHVCEHLGIPTPRLQVEVVPLLGHCRDCDATRALTEQLTCPACGRRDVQLTGGETAVIKSCEYAATGGMP